MASSESRTAGTHVEQVATPPAAPPPNGHTTKDDDAGVDQAATPPAAPPANGHTTKDDDAAKSTWETATTIVAFVGGVAAFVYLVGGIVMWLRFRTAGLPRDQAVALMRREELFVVGFRLMVVPALAAGTLAWLLMRRGRQAGGATGARSAEREQRRRRPRWSDVGALARAVAQRVKRPRTLGSELWSGLRSPWAAVVAVIVLVLVLVPFTFASAMWAVGAALVLGAWVLLRDRHGAAVAMALVAVAAAGVVSLGRQLDQPVQLLQATARMADGSQVRGVYVASDGSVVYIGDTEAHAIDAISRDHIAKLSLGPPVERAPGASLLSRFLGGDRFAVTPLEWWCNGERYALFEVGDLCQTQPSLAGPQQRPLDTTQTRVRGRSQSFAPVRVSCPAEADEGCRGWLRLETVDRYDPGPYGTPVPKRFGPVALSHRDSPGVIAPGRAEEHCVPIDSGARGTLRSIAPEGRGAPPQPVPFRAVISKDEAGRSVLTSSTYTLWIDKAGLPLPTHVTACSRQTDERRAAAGSP